MRRKHAVAWMMILPALANASAADEPGRRFPPTGMVVDVTRPPYSARGDGRADDTGALQKALDDVMHTNKILYVPNGIYSISATLNWKNKRPDGSNAYGFVWLQGESTAGAIIRLKDATFTDPANPKALMWCGGFGSADWFHNYIQGLTFDAGRGNPGAVGLQFYSNNTGALRDVNIVSRDGQGVTGLDLAHRDMNGPLLVRNLEVKGFAVGVRTGHSVNSQTFERVRLGGQSAAGFVNDGQCVSIRGLRSENAVPALVAKSFTTLLDSTLIGRGRGAVEVHTDAFHARNVSTSGYGAAVVDADGKARVPGPNVEEFIAGKPTSPFGGPARSLGLEVRETPEEPWGDPAAWAVVDAFGADPTGQKDSSAAIQRALDSGASTVFFPGFYVLEKPAIVRGKVRRLLGTGAWIDYFSKSKPDLIIADGEADTVTVEHFAQINGGLRIDTDRAVVLRSLGVRLEDRGKGRRYFEDVTTDDIRIKPGQEVWARQLNVENEGTHVTNDGGKLWILGYKTERGGTLLHTRNGGLSEVFGTFSYTTTAGKLAPMFVTDDASVFAMFNEVCYSGDPFATLVRETRRGETREVKPGAGRVTPYIGLPAGR